MTSGAATLRTGIMLLVLAVIAGLSAVAAAQNTTPAAPSAAGAAGPVTSPGNAHWAVDLTDARMRAAAEKKFVFIELGSPGCGNCQRMDALLYPAFDFEALLVPMVPVKIGLPTSEGRAIGDRYGIQETPAVLVTTPEGRLIFRMEGFLNTGDFYQHIRPDLDTYRAFARRVEAQDIPTLPAREALETGQQLYHRSDPESALPRLRRAADDPQAPAGIRDSAREMLAAVLLDLGQTAESRRTVDRLILGTKNPEIRERGELFRAQLPLSENKPAEALALFRKFLKDHPKSQYAEQVNATVARLAAGQAAR